MLDIPAAFGPPAPVPRTRALGPISLFRVLANNPLEAWTSAHFEQPIVTSGRSIGRVAVVSDPAAIRRVLFDNCENYQKDWLQRRILSAGLIGGLLTAEGPNWRTQRRALAPLFARKTVMKFSAAMIDVANRAGRTACPTGRRGCRFLGRSDSCHVGSFGADHFFRRPRPHPRRYSPGNEKLF